MTPFAAEISNSISRFITHKANLEDLSNTNKLVEKLYSYMSLLYPLSRRDKQQGFLCFAITHKKTTQTKNQNDVEEWTEYVPVYVVVDYVEPAQDEIISLTQKKIELSKELFKEDKTIYTLHADFQQSNIYLRKETIASNNRIKQEEEKFWGKMLELEKQLTTYTDVKNGFVLFITNNDEYWDGSKKNISLLQGCHYDKLTKLKPHHTPNVGDISSCQIVWKQTEEKGISCCIGTFDSYFHSEDYPCQFSLVKETKQYAPEFVKLENDNVKSTKVRSKKLDTYVSKFYDMLEPERIIPSSKKTFGKWENDFLNDYSRIMMSPAVRRMKDKTQVFSMDDSDFVRTRLTHSLEVANIAKLIGLGIESKLSLVNQGKAYPNLRAFHIPQILEVAGLIHDIGNPPYGHFGEKTIQNYFRNPQKMPEKVRELFGKLEPQQQADFQNFDGNVQGLRVLCHLGLSSDCTSFNLNKVILSSMIKYPFDSIEGNQKNTKDHRKSKFGYFMKEENIYKKICETLHLDFGQRHPLAYLLEAADDITYIGDDIEDAWKLGYISTLDIVKACEKLDVTTRKAIFNENWLRLRGRILSSNSIIAANAIQSMRIRLQRYMISKIIDVYCNILDKIVLDQLGDKQELFQWDKTLQEIHNVYWRPLVQQCYDGIHMTQLQGERVITSLLNIYLEAIADNGIIKWKTLDSNKEEIYLDNMSKSGMLFETISDNYRDDLAPIGQFVPQDAYGKIMLVTDNIAGMTDTFAYNRYRALCVD